MPGTEPVYYGKERKGMEERRRKRRRGRIWPWLLLGIGLVLLLAAAALVWYVAPAKNLDLAYTPVDMQPKLVQMAKARNPVMTLSGEEVNELCKKGLNDYLAEHPASLIRITGADFSQSGSRLTAEITGKAGPVPFGATVGMIMEASPESGGIITLRHEYTSIRGRNLPEGLLSFPEITVPLKEHMPFMVEVDQIRLLDSGIRISFALDWSDLLNLIQKLK